MVTIITTALICGTVAYLGYLGHQEWKETHPNEKPKPREFISIDEAFNQSKQQQEYRAE